MSAVTLDATRRQQKAANPQASVWVEASAGTGKTKVLTDRVLSLLLQGTAPSRLLCLTFTKAAAAEMANRIIQRLGDWSVPGDDTLLRDQIASITGQEPEGDMVKRARRLFATVLDAPGGLKIQTIHSFCQSLLGRFPIEAGLAPHFAVMDEASAAELRREALEAVLAHARTGDPTLGQALAILTDLTHEQGFSALFDSVLADRFRLASRLASHGGVEGLIEALARLLGLAPDETPETIVLAATRLPTAIEIALRDALPHLEGGKATDQKAALCIRTLLDATERASAFDAYVALFCTAKGERRARLMTKGCAEAAPWVADLLDHECERVLAVLERRRAAGVLVASGALTRLGAALLDQYDAAKATRMRLDYDDLILKARELLQREGGCAWVHYKLDGGIDHLLIDEAQDTNPEQWEVVAWLAAEFFVGEGKVPRTRTIFAVGDPKQSIFSFQGADPAAFMRMRHHFDTRVTAAMQRFEPVELHHSFRSIHGILDAVDTVFGRAPASDGVADMGKVSHLLSRQGHGGVVELWPPAPIPAAEPAEPWSPPTIRVSLPSPRSQVAQLIAKTIHQWLLSDEMLESRGRPIRAGDVLVLVRRRDSFVDELVRALKKETVPVAGIDRMLLADQLAVMDLMALGRFLLLPEDDLTLAALLKSPLIGLDEDSLFDLAYDRPASLWQSLRDRADAPRFAGAHAQLSGWLARADYIPPYELFARVLGAEGGRYRLLARLGEEAADPIDEFLNQALVYERSHAPSLQGFLLWLERGGLEVKRDGDLGERDEVRIMTVHGAKGLQAPIVFLPDTLQTPQRRGRPMWHESEGDLPLGPLWSPRKSADDPVAAQLRAALERGEDREYRRLLYVAMTRAEDRLYVTGWQSSRMAPSDCWYNLIADGLAEIGTPQEFDFSALGFAFWHGPGWRLATPQTIFAKPGEAAGPTRPIDLEPPSWASPAPPEPSPPRPLAPSRPEEEPPVRSPLGDDSGWGFRRGRLVHRLLQSLPDLAPEHRPAAARRFLSQAGHALDDAAREALLGETLAVLEHPEFAPIFAPGSRAEVPLVGRIGDFVIAGQIDRLAVTPDSVLIIDYKTNRPPPATIDRVPMVYLRQLAAYRGLLRSIYPDRPVRAALLWTDGPRLMPVAEALLDRNPAIPMGVAAKR